jgi:hypothetical protein
VSVATWTNFLTTVKSAKDLNADDIKPGTQVFVTLAGFAFVVTLSSFLSHWVDRMHETDALQKQQRKTFSIQVKKQSQVVKQPNHIPKQVATDPLEFLVMAEEALPQVLSSKSIWSRIVKEVKSHHRWFGVIFFYSRSFPRALRIVSLATNIVIMLFIQSITYNLTHGDDGTCNTFDQERDCLQTKSAYTKGSPMCYWQRDDGSCHYIEPDDDLKVMIYVAIFSAVVATPLAVLMDWLIMNVLVAPSKDIHFSSIVPDASRHNNTLYPLLIDMTPETESKVVAAVSENKRESGFFSSQRSDFELIAKWEFSQLADELKRYRQQLTIGNKKELDGKSLTISSILLDLMIAFALQHSIMGLG